HPHNRILLPSPSEFRSKSAARTNAFRSDSKRSRAFKKSRRNQRFERPALSGHHRRGLDDGGGHNLAVALDAVRAPGIHFNPQTALASSRPVKHHVGDAVFDFGGAQRITLPDGIASD